MDNSFEWSFIAGKFGDQILPFDAWHQTDMTKAVLDDKNDWDTFFSDEWSHSFVDEAKRTDHAQTQRRATPPPSSQAMSSSSMYTSQLSEPDSMLNDSTNLEDRIPMSVNNKHQCWDHGCNGREFSSKSNLTRHKKEREGKVAKVVCPFCGAIFSRSSARDTHLTNQSCDRIRRYSNGRPRPSRTALMDSLIQDRNTHDERFGTSLQYS